jgi:hypothetical protein
MSTARASELEIPWEGIRNKALSTWSQSFDYLQFTQQEQPELMAEALIEVLEAGPHAAGVAIPLYARLLKASDLERLAAQFSEASRYISEYRTELDLLLSA